MSESRIESLERLLRVLDHLNVANPSRATQENLTEEVTSFLRPFLENPDRHQRQVGLIVEYSNLLVAHRLMSSIGIFRLPFFRSKFRPAWENLLKSMKSRIEDAKGKALASVEPGELRLDVLPVISVPTEGDWKKQGLRLILLQTRGVVQPTSGMRLRAISHQIEITAPKGCRFIDAKPDSEMEVIGEREISTTERGKLTSSNAEEGNLEGSLSGGPATLKASLGYKEESNFEAEATSGEKLSHTPQVARVISSAVGDAAMWQLLRTPSRTLLGTQKFAASLLVPANARILSLSIRFGAEIEGWGTASSPLLTQDVVVPQ